MKTGTLQTQVPCSSSKKAAPAIVRLLRPASCGGLAVCDDPKAKIKVAYVCMDGKSFRKLKRSLERGQHDMAGRRK